MKWVKSIILSSVLVISILFIPNLLFAADITMYCRVSGGSSTSPYDTYAKAFNGVATISDKIKQVNSNNWSLTATGNKITVLMYGGTYANQLSLSESFVTNATYYITLKAQTGETPIIDPAGTATTCVEIWPNYTKVTSLKAQGSGSSGYSGFWTSADYVTFENCTTTSTITGSG